MDAARGQKGPLVPPGVQMAIKRWEKRTRLRWSVSLRGMIRNGNLPRQSCVRDKKRDVGLQRFSAAQSCHFLQQERRDVLSSHSDRLGSSQCRGDECFDFGVWERAFPGWGIGKQDARFRSLAGAALS